MHAGPELLACFSKVLVREKEEREEKEKREKEKGKWRGSPEGQTCTC